MRSTPVPNPFEDLNRLRKAILFADILEGGRIPLDLIDTFSDGQWNMVATIANSKPPSTEAQALIRELLRQRQAWRELVCPAA